MLDAQVRDYPQWTTGEEDTVFSPSGVAVGVQDTDEKIEVVVYAGEGIPRGALVGSGEIVVGTAGLVVGNCIDGDTDLIEWPAGATTVDVYVDRRRSGEVHRVRFVLRGEGVLVEPGLQAPSENVVERRAELILHRVARGEGPELYDAGNALSKLGRAAVTPLLEALSDPKAIVRELAAYTLGPLKDKSAVEPLILALGDGSREVRRQAAASLGWLRDRRAVEPLVEALGDSDALVRMHAAGALGKLRDRRAVEPLITVLIDEEEDWRVSEQAARSLGELKSRRAIEPLVSMLRTSGDHMRYAISQAFLAFGKSAIPQVLELLHDEDPELRRWAAQTLGHFRRQPPIEALASALHDPDIRVRSAAASALGQLMDPRGMKPLLEALHDEDSAVRQSAASSLSLIGDPSVLPALEVLRRSDTGVTASRLRVSDAANYAIEMIRLRYGVDQA